MANDLENQSTESSEDLLPYVFTEDALSEDDALASVDGEDMPNKVISQPLRTGMSELIMSDAAAKAILANVNVKMILANPLADVRAGD